MSESSIDGAVVVTQKIERGRMVPYVVYMVEPKADQSLDGRVLAIINDLGPETPTGLVSAAVEMDKIMGRTTRKNHGDDVVISFSPKRFDPNNAAHVAEAREIVVETLQRVIPDTPHLAVLQGDNGVLHCHIAAPNHNIKTGRARRTGWHHQEWRAINDQVLREHNIEPIVPGGAAVSEVERVAAARGLRVPDHDDLLVMDLTAITPRELDSFLAAQINEAIITGVLDAVPEPGAAALLPIGNDLSLSVRCGTKGGLSYAVTDGAGTPLKTAPGKRGAKPTPIARSAGKLDRAFHTGEDGDTKLYSHAWLSEMIAAMAAEEEREDEREDERVRAVEALESAARAEANRAAEYAGANDRTDDFDDADFDELDRDTGSGAGANDRTDDFDDTFTVTDADVGQASAGTVRLDAGLRGSPSASPVGTDTPRGGGRPRTPGADAAGERARQGTDAKGLRSVGEPTDDEILTELRGAGSLSAADELELMLRPAEAIAKARRDAAFRAAAAAKGISVPVPRRATPKGKRVTPVD